MALVKETIKVPEHTRIELKSLCKIGSPILRMLGVISPFEISTRFVNEVFSSVSRSAEFKLSSPMSLHVSFPTSFAHRSGYCGTENFTNQAKKGTRNFRKAL
ncbi:hypothetical protein ACN38_g133 [Penicillium nordicum]|uniref:Uncharacterized protein n=1 Tax=Penicillium nordicum TaxID=229535 RepID=A0A0M8PB42_9EURO|nr:hypothetical protein ACN38_g133 [Penicillium nordicum]